MPTSGWQHIPFIFNHMTPLCNTRKLNILDIGMGGGKWGVLIREFLDYRANRYWPKQWWHTLHGIEAFEKYRNPIWDYFYNHIDIFDISKNVREITKRRKYDYILLLDILEHFEKPTGEMVLRHMVNHCKEYVMCCFPNASNPERALRQGAVHGNTYEEHKSLWSVRQDFQQYKVVAQGDNLCAVKGEG